MPISVIIPALNEADHIAAAIAALRRQGDCEIIVADGGSVDGTWDLAEEADLRLATEKGRAAQMNAGAARASGDMLLFLHADCRLAPGALGSLARCLRKPASAAACFSMRVDAPGLAYRAIDWCATMRVRFSGVIYGDQGLGVRRDDFARIGGFPRVRFMEDVLISARLKKLGRMVVLPERVAVSARRWRQYGVVRQTLRNWGLTALALAGVHPDRLASWYPATREASRQVTGGAAASGAGAALPR
ncbi:MAG: TIGR04283 family arsenosugar biosynthesis glycosyltransferase [Gemmataceae bacterium]